MPQHRDDKPKSQVDAVQNRGRGRQQINQDNPPARPGASLRNRLPEVVRGSPQPAQPAQQGGEGRMSDQSGSTEARASAEQDHRDSISRREEIFALEPSGPQQGERASLRGPQPNRTVGEGLRSNAFGLRDGTQVVSASDGFQRVSFEPTTGRRIVTGEDGLARFESRIIGGDRGQRPSLRRGGIPDAGSRELDTTLASGTGEHGEPVFDNASIERGIESGAIRDPRAEEERIARNRLQDQQNLLHPSRRELEVEANNPAQAEVNAAERQSLREMQASLAGQQGERQGITVNTPIGELGGRSRQEIANDVAPSVNAALQSADIEVAEGEDVGGAFANFLGTSVQNAQNLPGIADTQDLIDLYAIARSMPGAATRSSSDSEPLDAAATLEMLQEGALNQTGGLFQRGDRINVGSDQFRLRQFQGRARSGMERIMQNYRQDVERQGINSLVETGKMPEGFNENERNFAEQSIREQGAEIVSRVPEIDQELSQLRETQFRSGSEERAGQRPPGLAAGRERDPGRAAQSEARRARIRELEGEKKAEEERINNMPLEELAAEIRAERAAQQANEETRDL